MHKCLADESVSQILTIINGYINFKYLSIYICTYILITNNILLHLKLYLILDII